MQLRVITFALFYGGLTLVATLSDAVTWHATGLRFTFWSNVSGAISSLSMPKRSLGAGQWCSAGVIAVDSIPVLRLPIGTLIDRPNRGTILGDHSVFVITENGHTLVGFDSAGRERWRHRITRAGTGGIGYFSDVFRNSGGQPVLWDHVLHQLSILDGGGHRRAQRRIGTLPPVPLPDGSRATQHLTIRGSFTDGQLLATTSSDPLGREGIRDDSVTVFRIDDRGNSHVIGKVLLAQQFSRTDPYLVQGKLPFGLAGYIAVAGTSWFYTDGSSFRIERRRMDGSLAAVLASRRARRSVDPEAIRRSRLESLSGVDTVLRTSMINALAAMPYPDSMAAYSDLKLDAVGTLWARVSGPDWEASQWDLYHTVDGRVAQLTLPPHLRVLDIGRRRLIAYHDAPGEGTALHVYDLCRP